MPFFWHLLQGRPSSHFSFEAAHNLQARDTRGAGGTKDFLRFLGSSWWESMCLLSRSLKFNSQDPDGLAERSWTGTYTRPNAFSQFLHSYGLSLRSKIR